jgi:hypothetical protein
MFPMLRLTVPPASCGESDYLAVVQEVKRSSTIEKKARRANALHEQSAGASKTLSLRLSLAVALKQTVQE